MATETLSSPRFYVYTYSDPRPEKCNCIIYVGKGTIIDDRPEWRAKSHWLYGSHNPFFQAVLNKIRALGLIPEIKVVAYFEDEAEAFELEISMIAGIGRRDQQKGSLLNMTDGGEGAGGLVVTAEMKEKHRIHGIATWANASPEFRATMLSGVGWGVDPEFDARRVARMPLGRAARWSKPGVKEADSEAIRQAQLARIDDIRAKNLRYRETASPEKLAEDAAKISAAKQRDAEKIGKKSEEVWDRPGMRESIGASITIGQTKAWAEPRGEQRRETARVNVAKQFSDPVMAEKHRLACIERDAKDGGLKARYADPEQAAQIIAKRKATAAANIAAADEPVRELVLDQWALGTAGYVIASSVGCTISRIRRIVVAAREKGDLRAAPRHGALDAVREGVLDQWVLGVSCNDIASHFSIPSRAVLMITTDARAKGDPRAEARGRGRWSKKPVAQDPLL